MTNIDKVCPGCHIALPADYKTDLRTDLCRLCVEDHDRRLEEHHNGF
jgi:hypothetical protein